MQLWPSYLDRPQVLPRSFLAHHSEPRRGLWNASNVALLTPARLRTSGFRHRGGLLCCCCSGRADAGSRECRRPGGTLAGLNSPSLSTYLSCTDTCSVVPCVMSAPEIALWGHLPQVDTLSAALTAAALGPCASSIRKLKLALVQCMFQSFSISTPSSISSFVVNQVSEK